MTERYVKISIKESLVSVEAEGLSSYEILGLFEQYKIRMLKAVIQEETKK